ncbi:uncharacterized protein [Typha angustifolia]|uniref:uncharacterized protein n=1 Tax=Typha angustifolia TaxID=59011 RepID=UPI003C2AD1C5
MEEQGEEAKQKKTPSSKQGEEDEKPQLGGGGWGGWGISSLSVFSDLQKAAEEISRNAVEVAKNAAKGITEIQSAADSKSVDAQEPAESPDEGEASEVSENERLRRSTLDKLEKASDDSLLGQGLKVIDSSVESFASGAWYALGGAWKGGSNLVHKLENSAANLAESIQYGALPVKATSLAPSLLETGKSYTAKGMEVLERVGKETMELLIAETGLEVEKISDELDQQAEDEQLEEITFDRCFYIYGGPDQLEELDALSSHFALLFNRRKAKLVSEQKSFYDAKLREIQRIFNLGNEVEENGEELDKGKNIETIRNDGDIEIKNLRDSSVSKAANMAAGFSSSLRGLAANEILQRTTDRLESIHSEGVHRLSELCCSAVSQLLILGKSIISSANKSMSEEPDGDFGKIDWPEDSVLKAKIIRCKARSMSEDVKEVSNSFVAGISDIIEAHLSSIVNASSDAHECLPQEKSIREKATAISYHLREDQTSALGKIQEALQYLAYVVLSTSMPSV